VAFAWWRFRFFHRNPERRAPSGADPLCPADGRIIYVDDVELTPDAANPYHERVRAAFAVEGQWTVVATYLSIFDVHFVRSPIAGRVRLHHIAPVASNRSMGGSFLYAALRRPLPLGRRDYTGKNEFLGVSIEGDGLRILLVLMADWWIDQIVTLIGDGETVQRGQLLGKIQMGSQVDLWAPAGQLAAILEPGVAVRAGETVIGVRNASL
ncbi:MAG TPA: phosphatidylserine decarboxylase, partial [Gemmatimonadaceae bacterium]|nr:phosphatidylserine decarboxylase [Gemmatimonadaceae bacterium]